MTKEVKSATIGFALPKERLDKVKKFFKGKTTSEVILWLDERITKLENQRDA